SVFTTPPAFVRAFGYGVDTGISEFETCTTTSGCQPGIAGEAAEQLDRPESGALSAGGDLYIGENDNNRISEYSGAPSFIRAFGSGVLPAGGTGFETCTRATGCEAGLYGGAGTDEILTPSGLFEDCRGARGGANSGPG